MKLPKISGEKLFAIAVTVFLYGWCVASIWSFLQFFQIAGF